MKRMKRKTSCLIMLIGFSLLTAAQNNAIFKGGSADGWDAKNYIQNSNSIFKGGNNDGWTSLNYIQQNTNIFKGGSGDGWDSKNYTQSNISIFRGGNGDGWDSRNYVQFNTGIFKGGSGDGWDSKNYVQLSLGIYKGGIGDGWASTYLPQTPVPVTFIYFNAQKQGQTASLLNWKTSQEINSAYFDVEQSTDAVYFTYIGRVNAAGNSQLPIEYYFTDNNPASGLNYYRIKQVDIDGHFTYTPSRLVRFDETNAAGVKYYPNPTNGLLHIELLAPTKKETRLVNITNAVGVVMNQLKLEASNDPYLQVDLGNYPKGIYFIQLKTASINSIERIVLQ